MAPNLEGALHGKCFPASKKSSLRRITTSNEIVLGQIFPPEPFHGDFGTCVADRTTIIFLLTSFFNDSIHSISAIKDRCTSMKNGKGRIDQWQPRRKLQKRKRNTKWCFVRNKRGRVKRPLSFCVRLMIACCVFRQQLSTSSFPSRDKDSDKRRSGNGSRFWHHTSLLQCPPQLLPP